MTGPRAAPAWRAVLAMTVMELRLALRRGESLVVTLVVPAAVLVFFGTVQILPTSVDQLVAATLAIAIVATGLVSLGIGAAYDRHYGVLKRLGGSPLPRWGIVAARILAVLVTEAVLVALLLAVAGLVLGWQPGSGADPAVLTAATALGTAAFAGLGLTLAGRLRAEATLALANALFVALLLAGGLLVPPEALPQPLGAVAAILPSGALVETLAAGLGVPGAEAMPSLAILTAWGLGLALVAGSSFRVE